MVYSELGTILCGHLSAGKNVNIKLINPKSDTEISVSDSICIESTINPGLYYFDTNNINDTSIIDSEINNDNIEIVYIMSDEEGASYGGKIVISKNYKKLNEQIKIVKDTLSLIPDDILESDVGNDTKFLELLLIIKRNSDLILV